MGKIPASLIRPPPPSHPYYLRSRRNKDRGGNEGNTEVLGNNFPCTYYSKRCQRKRLTRIESLPDDLLFVILVRLPAHDIYYHARFVCWKWYHMIHTRKFLYEHFKHVTYGLLFFRNGTPYVMTEQQGRIEISRLNYKLFRVLLSCNGLFLKVESCNCTVSVRNLITKQKLILPRPPLRHSPIYSPFNGIAFSAVSMEYKVVSLDISFRGPNFCFILTVGVDESWRKVEIGHLSPEAMELFWRAPLITEGFMHWARFGFPVLTLNIETEIFTEISVRIPRGLLSREGGRTGSHKYLSTGRYLSLLIGFRGVVWDVLEMKPETGEWRKVCDFSLKLSFDDVLMPVGWLKYPEALVFFVRDTLFFYNLVTQKMDWIETLLSAPLTLDGFTSGNMMVHKNSLCWFDRC